MCERGHSKWFEVSRVIGQGVLKKHCSFILAHRMKEKGTSALECGDLPLGHKLPVDYNPIGDLQL